MNAGPIATYISAPHVSHKSCHSRQHYSYEYFQNQQFYGIEQKKTQTLSTSLVVIQRLFRGMKLVVMFSSIAQTDQQIAIS
jgi:hypothetical protein